MLAVRPPGNVAREMALFRRRLFSASGETSALAFPELLPLSFGRRAPRETGPRASLGDGAGGRVGHRRRLDFDPLWAGLDGRFRLLPPVLSGGLVYLPADGPIAPLVERARSLLPAIGWAATERLPLESGRGFLLCRPRLVDASELLRTAFALEPPSLSFADCDIVLVSLRSGADIFTALSWRVLGSRSRRRV
jgi:hypothetical protein